MSERESTGNEEPDQTTSSHLHGNGEMKCLEKQRLATIDQMNELQSSRRGHVSSRQLDIRSGSGDWFSSLAL